MKDESVRRFAYDKCLNGLEQFRMREDRNGVATTGLLFMERSWDTAYLWENAESALSYFEAAEDIQTENPQQSRQYLLDCRANVVLSRTLRHARKGEQPG